MPNKEMKLTSAQHIGRSQLISGVRPTVGSPARGSRPGRGHGAPCGSSGRSGCGAPELRRCLPATADSCAIAAVA
jgi:hypothetical protein